MRKLLVMLGLGLLTAAVAQAGGGSFDDMPQQQMAPQGKVVVVTPPSDNTAIYVGATATIVTGLGVAYIGVRNRKRE